jgi:hypothetical protein
VRHNALRRQEFRRSWQIASDMRLVICFRLPTLAV